MNARAEVAEATGLGQAADQAQKQHFSTMSDNVQHLIRQDIEREHAQEPFDGFIQKLVDSGDGQSFSREELKTRKTG